MHSNVANVLVDTPSSSSPSPSSLSSTTTVNSTTVNTYKSLPHDSASNYAQHLHLGQQQQPHLMNVPFASAVSLNNATNAASASVTNESASFSENTSPTSSLNNAYNTSNRVANTASSHHHTVDHMGNSVYSASTGVAAVNSSVSRAVLASTAVAEANIGILASSSDMTVGANISNNSHYIPSMSVFLPYEFLFFKIKFSHFYLFFYKFSFFKANEYYPSYNCHENWPRYMNLPVISKHYIF